MPEADVGFMPTWRRPVRIPASVPLGHTEPPFAIAGQVGTWRAPLRLARDVPADAVLKLETASQRNNKPAFAGDQVERADADGYLTLQAGDGLRLAMRPDGQPGRYLVEVPETGLAARQVLTLVLGDRSGGGGGLRMPTVRALDKFVLLYVAADASDRPVTWNLGNAHQIVAACSVHILGGPIHHLRAYAPSQARTGRPFDLLVRPEDQFSNLSHELLTGADVLLGDELPEAEREPVAQSSCLRLRTTLPRQGVHRLKIVGRPGGWEAITNPIVCADEEPGCRVYWGVLHAHTEISDGREGLDRYFHQLRHEAALDFGATSDHDSLLETPDALWQQVCRAVEEWHEPGAFVTFLGYEWAKWRRNGDGDRNVYYLHDHRPMFRSDDGDYPTPPDLFRALKHEQAIVAPHHTANPGNWCDWKDHDPEHERLVEIYQALGSYECAEADGNPLAQHHDKPLFERGFVRDALATGWRVGFAGGGDDHFGHAGTEFPSTGGRDRYKAGLMAVLATERTREAIWDGLWNRQVIATTGPRILLDYSLNGHPMGSELTVAAEAELAHSRRLRVRCHGTAPVERIDIIRGNRVAHSVQPGGALDCEVEWEDEDPLESLWLPPARFCATPFCFYYVRALQADGEMAWASPVWLEP
jgi:hypothetical protein